MNDLPQDILDQIKDAYRLMATRAKYRPAAPSDGLGNITVPEDQLDLEIEAASYARRWWREEDGTTFQLGCCDYPTRAATIFAIEAARMMCGGFAQPEAGSLLRLALESLEEAGLA